MIRCIPLYLIVVGFLASGLMLGCSSKPVVVTEKEAGELVELEKGQELQVELAANPTTGFSWGLTENEGDILATSGKSFFTQDTSGEARVGAGGTETWVFDAKNRGKTKIQFEYRQPFEKGALPAKVVSFPVEVK